MCVGTDPSAFLTTLITTSAALVAIIGGLLIARFVGLDSEEQGTRRVLEDAAGRLAAARHRAGRALKALQDHDARDFLNDADVLDDLCAGVTEPETLRRRASCSLSDPELSPYITEIVNEIARARDTLAAQVTAEDGSWYQFRRNTPNLPEIRWPRVWAKVFDEVSARRAKEESRKQEEARRRGRITGLNTATWAQLGAAAQASRSMAQRMAQSPEYWQIRASRHDQLAVANQRAQQQAEDYQDEYRRLQHAHQEIVRPDRRLWSGVAILIAFTIVGVAWPMLTMSTGPTTLTQVHWLIYPFTTALGVLLVYIVIYLWQLTSRNTPAPPIGQDHPDTENQLNAPD